MNEARSPRVESARAAFRLVALPAMPHAFFPAGTPAHAPLLCTAHQAGAWPPASQEAKLLILNDLKRGTALAEKSSAQRPTRQRRWVDLATESCAGKPCTDGAHDA